MFAPIGISVYSRLEHFTNAIESLKKNAIAKDSHLVIFSDAAATTKDEARIEKVRDYAQSITGFKTVTLVSRPINYGGVRNAHEGLKRLVEVFDKAIFLEDDISVAPGFLDFMNMALDFYADNENVVSISGYSPPIGAERFTSQDYFTLNRFCGWGCGVYRRSVDWLTTKITHSEFESLENKDVLLQSGNDVLSMVEREVAGELDAADVRCMFRQAKYQVATVYPRKSLVQNNGHDGSGVHCGVTERFKHEELWDKTTNFHFSEKVEAVPTVVSENKAFRNYEGPYLRFKRISRPDDAKPVSDAYINHISKQQIKSLIADTSTSQKTNRPFDVAIVSTARAGTSWLSDRLLLAFGMSISTMWLQKQLHESYVSLTGKSDPFEYLNLIRDKAFSNDDRLALHFHVSQFMYWKDNYDVDIIEFFSFKSLYYVHRENDFEQSFSHAVASATGFWRHEMPSELNIYPKLKVKISEGQLRQSFSTIEQEKQQFAEHIKSRVKNMLSYEELLSMSDDKLRFVFGLEDTELGIPTVPKNLVDVVCAKNKFELTKCFEQMA